MSASKNIDRICIIITVLAVLLTCVFYNGTAFGLQGTDREIGYENRIFDRSRVHTIDIVMNDWDSFIATCESEEYSPCNLVIDGEAVKNVGIRGKGNTSLSSVKNMNSERYSFKIEFDQYENGKTYHGLDKLCLNNIIQDNTYMKDYLAYTLMSDFGVASPLCSYVYITVNGEDWGLYLAVEAIEDSFLERNFGSDYGDLYKPDAMSFGGGRGNGKDFSMTEFIEENSSDEEEAEGAEQVSTDTQEKQQNPDSGGDPAGGNFQFGGDAPSFGESMPTPPNGDFGGGDMLSPPEGEMPTGENGQPPAAGENGGPGGGGSGMGSSDVKLQYIDDDADSYSNIFSSAKTPVTYADQERLINALKTLSEQTNIESAVNIDEVMRYFVVHNFLVNGDSYTGQMIHNYYLYEEDGKLYMIPWDYNLAYGSFSGGGASSSVNNPIDTPVSNGMSDRPMVAWIFSSDEYIELYHQLFQEFLNSVDFEQRITETAALIDEYVQKDPTKFCTYEDFQTAVEAMKQFCSLREESIQGQLDGTIPSTSDGQQEDSSSLIDTSDLNISSMGSMGGGGGGGFGGGQGRPERGDRSNFSQVPSASNRPSNQEQNSTSTQAQEAARKLSN